MSRKTFFSAIVVATSMINSPYANAGGGEAPCWDAFGICFTGGGCEDPDASCQWYYITDPNDGHRIRVCGCHISTDE